MPMTSVLLGLFTSVFAAPKFVHAARPVLAFLDGDFVEAFLVSRAETGQNPYEVLPLDEAGSPEQSQATSAIQFLDKPDPNPEAEGRGYAARVDWDRYQAGAWDEPDPDLPPMSSHVLKDDERSHFTVGECVYVRHPALNVKLPVKPNQEEPAPRENGGYWEGVVSGVFHDGKGIFLEIYITEPNGLMGVMLTVPKTAIDGALGKEYENRADLMFAGWRIILRSAVKMGLAEHHLFKYSDEKPEEPRSVRVAIKDLPSGNEGIDAIALAKHWRLIIDDKSWEITGQGFENIGKENIVKVMHLGDEKVKRPKTGIETIDMMRKNNRKFYKFIPLGTTDKSDREIAELVLDWLEKHVNYNLVGNGLGGMFGGGGDMAAEEGGQTSGGNCQDFVKDLAVTLFGQTVVEKLPQESAVDFLMGMFGGGGGQKGPKKPKRGKRNQDGVRGKSLELIEHETEWTSANLQLAKWRERMVMADAVISEDHQRNSLTTHNNDG